MNGEPTDTDAGPDGEDATPRSLDADLRRGAELVESAQRLLGMLSDRVGDLPEVRHARARRLIEQLVDAADELDGMLMGIAARNAGILSSDDAKADDRHDDGGPSGIN